MEKILDDVRRDAITKTRTLNGDASMLTDAAMTILELHHTIRKEGLFALEEIAQNTESELFKSLAMLLMDAAEPDTMIEIATNAYWIQVPQGIQAMINYIYIRGMLAIRIGEDDNLLIDLLQSLLPTKLHPEYRARVDEMKKNIKTLYRKEITEKISNTRMIFRDTDLFRHIHTLEEEIRTLQDKSIQRLARDMDSHNLAVCVYACQEDVRRKILGNLSERYSMVIMEDAIHSTPEDEKKIAESIEKVQSMIRTLKKDNI